MALSLEQFELLPETVKKKLVERHFGAEKISDYVEITTEERIRILENIVCDWQENNIQPNSPKNKIVESIKMLCFLAERGANNADDDKYTDVDKYLSRNIVQEMEKIWAAINEIE